MTSKKLLCLDLQCHPLLIQDFQASQVPQVSPRGSRALRAHMTSNLGLLQGSHMTQPQDRGYQGLLTLDLQVPILLDHQVLLGRCLHKSQGLAIQQMPRLHPQASPLQASHHPSSLNLMMRQRGE